ncbi:MAG: hypothetical protein A2504_11500 [Bdellovibrionales bacterium RIFOXYD12_FULL_39_22]|nr:MAG: hypothetical protein A2385_16015 [Bdellovibrionales bacterium RIFOXYB1_FULL_39_21]OFZ44537.1 MAG: hypothetical protein A2485_06880 [Bdellovibrionales bacterium RIFOXYC12_FULL_39_17]OFZ49821.1 MAG: hypothetical protein A2404_00585 [Bdellovibrionales bacterium RIFOXYC1_FULL_39_130]OFZ76826.1 MAG: hypothetical protein A2560_05385 [Bdellovibrionales bacterium RIFOXYD1_FULL_39_84]OFZ95753.1 MAG: hypothetical protein A2504_11500 [Bdellovibrionales bacterium RIFOXYD12_FULL_39_22]HLE10771.1 hy
MAKENILLIQLSARERKMMIASIILIITVFYTMWYRLQITNIENLKKSISELETQNSSNQSTLATLNLQMQTKTNFTQTSNKKKNQDSEDFWPTNNLAILVKKIAETSAEKSIQLNTIALISNEINEGVVKNTFSIEIKSSFLELAKFLENLEQSAEWLAITSVNITRFENELKECEAIVLLNTFEMTGNKP